MSVTPTCPPPSQCGVQEGATVWALNPKYRDGTRLRASPSAESEFNKVWVPNDTELTVLEVSGDFANVQKPAGSSGWIRIRNLSTCARQEGIRKGVVRNEVVTPDPDYVRGVRIYGVGIKQDPYPGEKRGKGVQHLISPQWLSAMAEFIGAHLPEMKAFAGHAQATSLTQPGYDYKYFTNAANHLLDRAIARGLRTRQAVDDFLMASWLIMAASEVDSFPFEKYTQAERSKQREAFYEKYKTPKTATETQPAYQADNSVLGRFALPTARHDLLPHTSLERLGVNNELSSLKYSDPTVPMREGFLLSSRLDSLARHFEAVHRGDQDEDHIIHLLWNFHAIYHVLVIMPSKNDLPDYALCSGSPLSLSPSQAGGEADSRPKYIPTSSLEEILKRTHGEGTSAVLKLDWNEGALPPPPSVAAALTRMVELDGGGRLKWYPQLSGGLQLREALAIYCSAAIAPDDASPSPSPPACVIPESVLVTNGSDDALVLLCQEFLGHQKRALAPKPTYAHFAVNAQVTGAEMILWEQEDPFTASVTALETAVERDRPDLVYLVSPNNPTGVQWPASTVRSLSFKFPDTLFLVDEAYHEFASPCKTTGRPQSCVGLAVTRPNVVVTRTFSKAFCLAAVRCGYLIAHPNVIERLLPRYNPKAVNLFAATGALAALGELKTYYDPYVAATAAERERFIADLKSRGVDVRCGSGGNFVCVAVPGGQCAELARLLAEQGIFVRDVSRTFPGYVRITIGVEMTRVADALVGAVADLEGKTPAGGKGTKSPQGGTGDRAS